METMHSRAKALLFGQRSSEDIATALRGRGLAAGETEIIESTDTAKALCFAIRGRSNFKHTMWLFAGEIDGDGYALVMIGAAGSGPAILEGIAKGIRRLRLPARRRPNPLDCGRTGAAAVAGADRHHGQSAGSSGQARRFHQRLAPGRRLERSRAA